MILKQQIEQLSHDKNVYTTILEAGRENPDAVVPQLLAALQHPDSLVRTSVINILGVIGDTSVGQTLTALADDSDVQVRRAVAAAVPKLLAPEDGSATVAKLLADESAQVRNVAAQAVRHYHGETKFQLLATIVQDEQCDYNVYKQLGETQDPRAIPLLEVALNNPKRRMRQFIISALEAIGTEEAAAIIIAQLKSPEPIMRGTAAQSLGKLKYQAAVSQLQALLADEAVAFQGYGPVPTMTVAAAARVALKNISG